MRKILIVLFLLGVIALNAQVVARVGEYYITQERLDNEIDYLFDLQHTPSTYHALRRQALNNLIEEYLMVSFADEYGITVDSSEVEAYFINEYGDHSQFQENGAFSYLKFKRLSKRPQIRKIMQDLQRDLLLGKTRKIIEESFEITDAIVRDQYITSRFRFDIGYITIDGELLDVSPSCNTEEAMQYYQDHSRKYRTPAEVRLELFVLQNERFKDAIKISQDELMRTYMPFASVYPLDEIRDSLVAVLQEAKQRLIVRDSLESIRDLVRMNDPAPISPVITDFLREDGVIGDFPAASEILSDAFEMREKEISEIYDVGFGFLFFRVLDKKEPHSGLTPEVGKEVWLDYAEDHKDIQFSGDFRQYYEENIDQFIVPAAYVTRVVVDQAQFEDKINIPEAAVRQYYQSHQQQFNRRGNRLTFSEAREQILEQLRNESVQRRMEDIRSKIIPVLFDNQMLRSVAAEYNIKLERTVVFLDRLENVEPLDDYIAYAVKRNQNAASGIVNYQDRLVIYRVDSVFPQYIPSYEQVKIQLPKLHKETVQADTSDYRLFYTRNQPFFTTPDSLSLAGVYYPIELDSVRVSEEEVHTYFQNHPKEFYMSPRVEYQVFFLSDPEGKRRDYSEYLYRYASREKNLELIQELMGSPIDIPSSGTTYMDELPVEYRTILERIFRGEVSEPAFVNGGWLMVMKISEKAAGAVKFNEVKGSIRHKLEMRRADSLAYAKAKYIFDNANYYADVLTLADSVYVHETERQSIDGDFAPFGRIKEIGTRIMQLYRNEKYTSIIKSHDGYSVVFMRYKKYGRQIAYEDAISQIQAMYDDEARRSARKEYLINLIDGLDQDDDPKTSLVFLGEWKHASDLTVDGEIPGVQYSEYILADAIKKQEGEYCYPILLQNDSYLVYRVENTHKADKDSMEQNLKSFREEILQQRFDTWMNDYRATVGVEVY